MPYFNFGMDLVFEEGNGFVFGKVLNGGHLYQNDDQQQQKNNATDVSRGQF